MAEVDLLHRIYTHAASGPWETTGARPVPLEERDAASALSEEARADLDDLLRKVVPAGNTPAWAVRRFVSGNDSYACLVVSYPDLVSDGEGRRGLITHARLARVEVGEAWLDAPALVEAAMDFPIAEVCATPAEGRLAEYLNLATRDSTVTLRAVPVSELQQLPRAALSDFLIACFAVLGSRQQTPFALPAGVGIGDLALSWCAVPVGVQRYSAWALGVADGCPVDAVFSSSSSPASSVAGQRLVECVRGFVDLLHDAPQTFSSILRNPDIFSLVKLDEVVRRAIIAAPLSTDSSGKGEMSKKDKGKAPRVREEGEPLEAETISEMERQYRALEASLRMYVDQRLGDLEARLQLTPPPQPKRAPSAWIAGALGAGLVAAIVVILFMMMGAHRTNDARQVRNPTQATSTAATESATTTQVAVIDPAEEDRKLVASAIKSAQETGNWSSGFKDFLDKHGAVVHRAVLATASNPDVDDATAAKLRGFAARIAKKEDLKADGRDELRKLLLDAIAARVASDQGLGGTVKVDGNVDDIAPILAEIKTAFGVKSRSADLNDRDLQSEIVFRWMEKR